MTVQELIDLLNEVEDKSLDIEISTRDGWMTTIDNPYIEIEKPGSGWCTDKPIVIIH